MDRTEFDKGVIKLFAEKTECNIQNMGRPCNTCFHSIDRLDVDFQHICWLLVLSMDKSNNKEDILKEISVELDI